MTKVAAVIQILKEAGGHATWEHIYAQFPAYYPNMHTANDWKAGVRGIVFREIRNGRNFKKVGPSTYALSEQVVVDAEETIEGVRRKVDKTVLLRDASDYKNSGPSHRVSSSPKKLRIESHAQKKRIAELEDYACQVCGWSMEYVNSQGERVGRIDVDHIIDKAKGGGEELANLWALCPNCHVKKTLGAIKINPIKKKITENGRAIYLHHDSHLGPGWRVAKL